MSLMNFEECARCGRRIVEGEIRYVVRLTVVGDDGGVIEELGDPDSEIESLLRQIEEAEIYELESDVFEERVYILCGSCKKEYMKNPFGPRRGDIFDDDFTGPIQ